MEKKGKKERETGDRKGNVIWTLILPVPHLVPWISAHLRQLWSDLRLLKDWGQYPSSMQGQIDRVLAWKQWWPCNMLVS